MTGASKTVSSSSIRPGASAADDERISLKGQCSGADAPARRAAASIARWIVGTAVYHVGRSWLIQRSTTSGRNPGVQMTLAPARSEESSAPTRPWMWNKGMTLRHRSPGSRRNVVATCFAEARRFPCVSGTILARPVVPEVCSISATSSARGSGSGGATRAQGKDERSRSKRPAGESRSTLNGARGTPRRVATSRAGVTRSSATTIAAGERSSSKNSSSARPSSGFSGAQTAAVAVPRNARADSGPAGSIVATRAERSIPAAASAPASSETPRSSSACVSAGRPGAKSTVRSGGDASNGSHPTADPPTRGCATDGETIDIAARSVMASGPGAYDHRTRERRRARSDCRRVIGWAAGTIVRSGRLAQGESTSLTRKGSEVQILYRPHRNCFAAIGHRAPAGGFPNADRVMDRALSLPCHHACFVIGSLADVLPH
jgi:hypothetical protein